MNDLLSSALRELELVMDGPVEVVRVDVDDAGALHLTVASRPGTRWFSHDDRGLIERLPEQDPALPLAARLAGEDAPPWRTLSYRPGRRMVVETARNGVASILKGYRQARSARAALNHGLAERAMHRGAFRVPRLLRHDGELETLVFEHLDAREAELDLRAAPVFARLGERLAVFQREESARDLKAFAPRDELAVLDRWRRKLERIFVPLPSGWVEARGLLEVRLDGLPAPELGLAHRDLHDRQVLQERDGLALFDFDLLCAADVALDAGNLLAHLTWRALQGLHGADEASVRSCGEAFLAGLAPAGDAGFERRLSFYRASTWLRLALVYRLRPPWSTLTPRLVERAGAALDDLAWSG